MTRVMCDVCDEEMEAYDEQVKKEWKEEFFSCEKCNTKKIKRTLFNENGAEISEEVEHYYG